MPATSTGSTTTWANSAVTRTAGWQDFAGGTLVDVGPDGTVWKAGGLGDDGSFRGDYLGRFADGEWTQWTAADLPDIRLGLDYEFEVAPDGSLWFGLWRTADGELSGRRLLDR